MVSALEVRGVSRGFRTKTGPVHALRDVSFSAGTGEVVGLLGLNGAGKTTLIKIISTLLLPTAGSVHVDGVDVVAGTRRARSRLSVVFGGDRGLYGRLSGRDNARFFGTLAGLGRRRLEKCVTEALDAVSLGQVADRAVDTYSRGMRQRLHLAVGLMTTPALLMLDEPTVGLDPIEAGRLRQAVAELARGVTGPPPCVLLTSHYLKDIEEIADRVIVLQEGRLTHDLPLEKLLGRASCAAVVTLRGRESEPPLPTGAGPSAVRLVDVQRAHGGEWTARYEIARWDPAALRELGRLWPDGEINDVRVEPVGLERVFRDLSDGGGSDR